MEKSPPRKEDAWSFATNPGKRLLCPLEPAMAGKPAGITAQPRRDHRLGDETGRHAGCNPIRNPSAEREEAGMPTAR
jgi:hypothetical protein